MYSKLWSSTKITTGVSKAFSCRFEETHLLRLRFGLLIMNNIAAIHRANEEELKLGLAGGSGSWHTRYAHSPVIYIGGIPDSLTEGDVLTIFEQMGRIVHINRVRDKETGKPRGFAFIAYHDVRSTVIAVDNFNGIKILGNTLCVDHVENYKPPDPETTPPLQLSDDIQQSDARPHTTGKLPSDANRDTNENTQIKCSSIQRIADDGEEYRLQQMMQRLAAVRRMRLSQEKQGSQPPPSANPAEVNPNSISNNPIEIDPVVANSSERMSQDENKRDLFRPDYYQERIMRREERRRIRERRAERRSN
jgi:RNA-binding motif protein, X-linked 2